MQYHVNNRLDIYDPKKKRWYEAYILEIKAQGSASTGAAIRVHYKGFNS